MLLQMFHQNILSLCLQRVPCWKLVPGSEQKQCYLQEASVSLDCTALNKQTTMQPNFSCHTGFLEDMRRWTLHCDNQVPRNTRSPSCVAYSKILKPENPMRRASQLVRNEVVSLELEQWQWQIPMIIWPVPQNEPAPLTLHRVQGLTRGGAARGSNQKTWTEVPPLKALLGT